ncbi:Imm8 family immunity protein [Amniculibacterium aquaticum]|jgi:hypothetical protein|uniref:Imm8 family immunity protein n=1 Tax=Amniculibacterium aquaticum TaxID=2479858 RepID=UPI000F59EDA3|nr:Imm8 family immunity protein [Amniculibacterium aquaticum]
MRAEIKNFYSNDIDLHLSNYNLDNDNFGIWARIIVGERNGIGEESFDIFICTPQWLKENIKNDDAIFGYHYMIVNKFDYLKIYNKLEEYVNNIDEKDWKSIANKISFIGKWEFDGYTED